MCEIEIAFKKIGFVFERELRGGFVNEIICNFIEMNGLVFNLKLCD